jgi:hypothetical protein
VPIFSFAVGVVHYGAVRKQLVTNNQRPGTESKPAIGAEPEPAIFEPEEGGKGAKSQKRQEQEKESGSPALAFMGWSGCDPRRSQFVSCFVFFRPM